MTSKKVGLFSAGQSCQSSNLLISNLSEIQLFKQYISLHLEDKASNYE